MRDPVSKYKTDDGKDEGHPKLSAGLYTLATRKSINTEKRDSLFALLSDILWFVDF